MILCEGQSDEAFFRHLTARRHLPELAICYPGRPETETGGRRGFGDVLRAIQVVPGFESLTKILVVSENDEDTAKSFSEVQEQIASVGFPIPAEPLAESASPSLPRVSILMLPWANEVGNLESLCLPAAYAAHPGVKACLDEYCTCSGTENWPITKNGKMRLRSLIAAVCRSDPNTGLAYAWSRSVELIPLEHGCFDRIAEFLRTF